METTLYNPASLAKESLIENFVVRTRVFEKIFEDIMNADMKYPEQHYLIQGQRGMGKTTLLLRLKYEVENTQSLNSWLIPVFFNEESYDITSLSNLWEKLLKCLDDYFHTDGIYYNHTESFLGDPNFEKRCFEYLLEKLHEHKKKLIIFFDNFGQLFLDNLKKKEKQRLREILMSCNDIRVIGASAIVLNDLHDYSEPFYEFFKIIPLEGLSTEETYELFNSLKGKLNSKIEINKHKAKIHTLTVLTGGVIRTLMLMYEVLIADEDGSALNDLEIILDKITPLYKHRVEDLPVQQRKIIDVIAKNWDAISTKEISTLIRDDGKQLSTKLISAQLQQLERNNVIEKKQTNTKNHLYQLKERFFNIWYLMRHGNKGDRKRVQWLTKFLEVWYDDEASFEDFLKRHIDHLKTGKYHSKSAILLTEALFNSEKLNLNSLEKIFDATSEILNDEEKKLLPNIINKKLSAVRQLSKRNELDECIKILKSISTPSKESKKILASIYAKIRDYKGALDIYENFDDLNSNEVTIIARLQVLTMDFDKALVTLENFNGLKDGKFYYVKATILSMMSKSESAKACYKKAIELGDEKAHIKLKELLVEQKDFKNAELLLKDGVRLGIVNKKELLVFYLVSDERPESAEKFKELIKSLNENQSEVSLDPDLLLFQGMSYVYEGTDESNDLNLAEIGVKLIYKAKDQYRNGGNSSNYKEMLLNFLLLYFVNYSFNRTKAKEIISEIEIQNDMYFIYSCFIKCWDSNYKYIEDELISKMNNNLLSSIIYEFSTFNDLLLLLMSRKQYHLALRIFNGNYQLKEILKPTYYALISFLKKEYPNEMVKMGSELDKPVKQILEKIEQMKIDYK